MTFSWSLLVALGIFGIVSLSRQQHHHGKGHSSPQSPTGGAPTASSSTSWEEVPQLDRFDSKRLESFLTPLVAIAANAYGGSDDVAGWRQIQSFSPASGSEAGARAVLFQESSGSRLVLAFRGTLTQPDFCVDRLLFGNASPMFNLPSASSCMARYTNESLDYLSQSVDYTREVVKGFPGAPLLLTGHSLGGALAALVSVSLDSSQKLAIPAVGFCTPGGREVLKNRGVAIGNDSESRVYVIGDEWDPVVRSFWTRQLGTVCLVEHQEPSDCEACFSGTNNNLCSSCMQTAHSMSQVLGLLDQGAAINCTQARVLATAR